MTLSILELPLRSMLDNFVEFAKAREDQSEYEIREQMKVTTRGTPQWIELRNRLVANWYLLAFKVARKYAKTEADREDMLQQAVLGAIHAADKFDPHADNSFSTYAYWWMAQKCQRYRAENWHQVTGTAKNIVEASKLFRAMGSFFQVHGRKPSDAELSEITGIERDRIRFILALSKNLSLDFRHLRHSEKRRTLADSVAANGTPRLIEDDEELDFIMSQIRNQMDSVRFDILCRRYGLCGCDVEILEQIAASHGITKERVRQLEDDALAGVRAVAADYGYVPIDRKTIDSYQRVAGRLQRDSKKSTKRLRAILCEQFGVEKWKK